MELAAFVVLPLKVKPLTPLTGTFVAAIVPEPVAERVAPEPICIAAWVFVELVMALNAVAPVLEPVIV